MQTSEEIRKAFIDFWTESPRNHTRIQNISLVPNVDSTLLFVNSGMFPLATYLAGEKHPQGKRLCNFQRCLRTKYDEMVEIGDNRHTLMFEMMGNWSFGDYTKVEQIPWMLEVYVEKFGLDPKRLYVTVWEGDELVPRDELAIEMWKKAFGKYGINAKFSEDITNIPKSLEDGNTFEYKIFPYGKSDNWWKRGDAPGELGGPSSEIFYDMGEKERDQEKYHINDDSGRFIEIGNSVFMEYKYDENMKWQKLEQSNIDFGGGFERVVMCAQAKKDIFETDVFKPVLDRLEGLTGKAYKTDGKENENTAAFRVLADHGRVSTFVLADGVAPSNKDQGYILRRFIRRLVRFGKKLGLEQNFTKEIATAVIERLRDIYPHLEENKEFIFTNLEKEENAFRQTLSRGLKELEKIKERGEVIDGKKAFYIYETYGFPLELTLEELNVPENESEKIKEEYLVEEKSHREQSRAGAEQKFKGGLADQSEATTRLHTAHHLLLGALRQVLGTHVHQKGSNITGERLRIDFTHTEKLTEEEVLQVEAIVNEKIHEGWSVIKKTLPIEIAEKLGAEMEFGAKYGDMVDVYLIVNPEVKYDYRNPDISSIAEDMIFSKEFCGGPHVSNTKELLDMGNFKISKQESSGSGIRRIKAILG